MAEQKLIKDKWVYVSDTKAIFAGGEEIDIYQYGKVIGSAFSFTCSVEIASDGSLSVGVEDDNATYTGGSYTSAHIPSEVIQTLIKNNKRKYKVS
jgi:hypothetical protein